MRAILVLLSTLLCATAVAQNTYVGNVLYGVSEKSVIKVYPVSDGWIATVTDTATRPYKSETGYVFPVDSAFAAHVREVKPFDFGAPNKFQLRSREIHNRLSGLGFHEITSDLLLFYSTKKTNGKQPVFRLVYRTADGKFWIWRTQMSHARQTQDFEQLCNLLSTAAWIYPSQEE